MGVGMAHRDCGPSPVCWVDDPAGVLVGVDGQWSGCAGRLWVNSAIGKFTLPSLSTFVQLVHYLGCSRLTTTAITKMQISIHVFFLIRFLFLQLLCFAWWARAKQPAHVCQNCGVVVQKPGTVSSGQMAVQVRSVNSSTSALGGMDVVKGEGGVRIVIEDGKAVSGKWGDE